MNPAVPVPGVEHPVPSWAIHPAQAAFDGLAGYRPAPQAGEIRLPDGDPQRNQGPAQTDPRQPELPGMEAY